MNPPKKVTVRQEPEGPVFIYHWRQWGFIILVPFGLFFTAIPFWIGAQSEAPAFVWVILLLFAAIGLGLVYWALGWIINRSEIRLQHGQLSTRQKPLPWRYNADLEINDIQAVGQETYYHQSQDTQSEGGFSISFQGSFRNERLAARTRTGKTVILIPKIELAAAQFLEQEIEINLGMRQVRDAEAQNRSVQEAQQEQKILEAGQTKMAIPILILTIPLLIGMGIWMLITNFQLQREAKASLDWPSVTGKSTSYMVYENVPDNDDNYETYYTASVEYTYIVDGSAYTYEESVPGTFDTGDDAAMYVETNIPEHTPLTLYYNPEKPARALADRSGPGTAPIIIGAGCLVIGILALVFLVFLGKWICKTEGCPDAWKTWNFWGTQIPFIGRFVARES